MNGKGQASLQLDQHNLVKEPWTTVREGTKATATVGGKKKGKRRDDPVANSINEIQKHSDSTPAFSTQLGNAGGNDCCQNCIYLADVHSLFFDLKYSYPICQR